MTAWGADGIYVPDPGKSVPYAGNTALPCEPSVLHLSASTPSTPMPGLDDAVAALGTDTTTLHWEPLRQRLGPDAMGRSIRSATLQRCPSLTFWHVRTGWVFTTELVAAVADATHASGGLLVAWCDDPGVREQLPRWAPTFAAHADVLLFTNCDQPYQLLEAGGVSTEAAVGFLGNGYSPETFHPPRMRLHNDPATGILRGRKRTPQEAVPVTFVGRNAPLLDDGDRETTLAAVREHLGLEALHVAGSGWERLHGGGAPSIDADSFRGAAHRSEIMLGMGLRDDLRRYTSDRMQRAMGSGAVYACREMPDAEGLGLRHGENCLLWQDTDDLLDVLEHWTGDAMGEARDDVRRAAAIHAKARWSWGQWRQQLLAIVQAERVRRVV